MKFLKINQLLISDRINQIIDDDNIEPLLKESMIYASIGGKALRATLLLETAKAFGIIVDSDLISLATSIELIHSYSLVHDDLPAIDNDDLRRNKPTVHKKYGEDIAILTGDSLYGYAFEMLLSTTYSDSLKIKLLNLLTKASGPSGMIYGQIMDVKYEIKIIKDLKKLHLLKTGKMLELPILMALEISNQSQDVKNDFKFFSKNISLAFQAKDDLLDVVGDFKKVGKTLHKDELLNKKTYIDFLGIEETKKEIELLIKEAIKRISSYRIKSLEDIANFIKDREY